MKKKTFLKSLSFTSLALLMGIAGTMAFAPLGASPSVASASEITESTTEQGLITPKADDPVIYTTESGLEIKWGNAIGDAVGGGNEEGFSNLSSGNLKNLPYFTTKSGSTTYTWVIIGQNLSSYDGFSYQNLTYWQTNKSQSTTYTYFFNNIYETTTPAGSAIKDNILNDYTARKLIGTSLLSSVTKNTTEIPAGCVLVLANDCVGTSAYSTREGGNGSYTQGFGGSENTLTTLCTKYYTDDTFGFNGCLSAIKPQTVTQRVSIWTGSADAYSTNRASMHFFPLGHDATYDNFRFSTYLTADQVKLSVNVVLRTMLNHASVYYINTSGVATANTATNPYPYNHKSTWYVRPACVISVV